MKILVTSLSALCLAAAAADGQELRIGHVNTLTGGGAGLGKALENGWKLGLEHNGWREDGDKLGGVPTRIFYADDQLKPEIGVREVEKMLNQHKVQIVAGNIWSNVLMAVSRPVWDAKALLLSTNAGPAPIAGELCNPLFVSTSFQNDQNAEAMGELVTSEGIKTVYGMAPNYQAGKDFLAGFERTYKGKVIDRDLYKVGETDFQAEFSRVRAAKPEAVFVFGPGGMGIAFMKQWAASGLGKEIKLRSVYTVDEVNLPALGDAAVGDVHTNHWSADFNHERNQRFVKSYVAKYGHMPAAYAAANYDAVGLIARTMKELGGKTDDMLAVSRTMRRGGLASVRGDLKYNVNGFLIQPYYRREVVKGADGKPMIRGADLVFQRADSYGDKCPADKRI